MLLCPNHQTGFNQFCKTGNRHYFVSFITYFCLLVTLVAWFSFCFFCLALQNVNKGFIIFYNFETSLPKVTKNPKWGKWKRIPYCPNYIYCESKHPWSRANSVKPTGYILYAYKYAYYYAFATFDAPVRHTLVPNGWNPPNLSSLEVI